ncbi:MAG: hypothetical protein LCI00_19405 [Chloroflexi bacterium]|nr:hypothetical protein [Chloroflexota bacterium]MCC6891432.1 hypothetical protein [Anaerolineae bacterium]
MTQQSSRIHHLVALACFFGLALLALYWPLFNMATHLTGDIPTDYFHFHWNFWWVRHALAAGHTIYETNYVLYPYTSSLVYHTLTVFWYPLWALLEPAFGTVPAMSAVFVANYLLCGYSVYLLLRQEGVSAGLALVGGALLELSPLLTNSVYWTNINLMGWFWLPLLLMTWGKIARQVWAANWRFAALYALLLGCTFWAMLLDDLQYPIFAAFLLVPYGLLMLWQSPSWSARVRLVTYGLLAIAVGLVLLWFIGPLRYLLSYDSTGLSPTPMERAVTIPFPLGFISHLPKDVSVGAVLLPLVLVALLAGWWRRGRGISRMRWFWLALMILPLLLAGGASITIGETPIPMPYAVLHTIFGGMFRYPERFAPVFTIPAVLFVGMSLTPILKPHRFLRLAVPVALLLLVAADSWLYTPDAIQPIPYRYSFYESMGREPYDYVVIESPSGGSSGEGLVGEQRFAALQWYGTIHGKRMVNGHISRVNAQHFWFMRTDDPLLAWLGQRRFLESDLVEPELRKIITEWPVGYIVIHQDMIGRSGPTTQEIIGYLNSLPDLVCPVWVEHEAVVYRTSWHPEGCPPRTPPQTDSGAYSIDLGTEGDERYIGWGWHYPEMVGGATTWRWTGEYPQTELYVDLPAGSYSVSLAAQAFYEPRTLTLLANGVPLGEPVTVAPDTLQTLTFNLPADVVGDGRHITLTLDYDNVVVPKEAGQGGDERKLAVAVDYVAFILAGD